MRRLLRAIGYQCDACSCGHAADPGFFVCRDDTAGSNPCPVANPPSPPPQPPSARPPLPDVETVLGSNRFANSNGRLSTIALAVLPKVLFHMRNSMIYISVFKQILSDPCLCKVRFSRRQGKLMRICQS